MICIDAVAMMRDIRDKLSDQYAKMTPEEISRIHENFPDIKWKTHPAKRAKSVRAAKLRH